MLQTVLTDQFVAFLVTKEVTIYKPFVLGITHKDSSIRKLRFLHMSMNGDFCAELHNSKACSNLLETMIQCKITLKFSD